MAFDNVMPFERGTTWKDGNTASTAVPAVNIHGAIYENRDDESEVDYGHRSAAPIRLRATVNRSGSTITYGYTGLRYSTLTSVAPLTAVNGAVAAAAIGGCLVDDRYSSGFTIAAGDIFWSVAGGPVRARMSTRGGSISVGNPLSFTTGAKLRAMRTSEGKIIAEALEACTTEGVIKLCNVVPRGFHDEVV